MTILNGYCTLAELQAWEKQRSGPAISTDTGDDAVMETLIEAASRHIDGETARYFYKEGTDSTMYYTAKDSRRVDLPDYASITSVSVDYSLTRSYTLLVATDYDTLPDNSAAEGRPIDGLEITPTSTAYFPTQRRGVKIIGKRGRPAVPLDVKEACLLIAQAVGASRSGQSSIGRVTVTAAGVVIRPEDVPAKAQAIINHYKNIR